MEPMNRDTQRNDNVIITSKLRRRFGVIMTLLLRHMPVDITTTKTLLDQTEFVCKIPANKCYVDINLRICFKSKIDLQT